MNKNKGLNILTLSLALSGIISTTSGLILNKMNAQPKNTKVEVKVIEKQVAKIKSNIPILKDVTVEVNEPISVDVKEYIANMDDISEKALKQFKLDTSLVNVTQAGKYTYTISYKSKKYRGNVIVNEKVLPNINIKLKNLSIKLNSPLPTDVKDYIDSTIPDEVLQTIKPDLSKVNTKIVGDYQYTITYNKQLYTGTISIYEEQPTQKLNTISYTLKYYCGEKLKEEKISKTENKKTIELKQTDIIKPAEFTECSNGIDTVKSKLPSFPINITDGNTFTIYFKTIVPTNNTTQKN